MWTPPSLRCIHTHKDDGNGAGRRKTAQPCTGSPHGAANAASQAGERTSRPPATPARPTHRAAPVTLWFAATCPHPSNTKYATLNGMHTRTAPSRPMHAVGER